MQHNFKKYIFFFIIAFFTFKSEAQNRKSAKWSALFAVGVNYPTTDGFVKGSYAQSVNFPTINLGLQHMLKRNYGVKLDYGFNRFSNADDTPEFKINYSRVNAQFVYNPTQYLTFLPRRLSTVAHAGPGIAFVKPLGTLGHNKQTFLNVNAGIEFHYAINEKVAVYTDIAYLYGVTSLDDYNLVNGLGAFNGSVFNLTFGLAVSLSGCQYCD